jgi:hypothetical protein
MIIRRAFPWAMDGHLLPSSAAIPMERDNDH